MTKPKWTEKPDGDGWYWVVHEGAIYMGLLFTNAWGTTLDLPEIQTTVSDEDGDGKAVTPTGLLWFKVDLPTPP